MCVYKQFICLFSTIFHSYGVDFLSNSPSFFQRTAKSVPNSHEFSFDLKKYENF